MSGIILYVGTAGFTEDDLPEQLTLGGIQSYVQRKFPGGQIQVQTLGSFDDDITWSGEFLGANAWNRAKAIDEYRLNGKEVLIKFKEIAKYGIVSKFNPSYMHDGHVPYTITLTPSRSSSVSTSVGSVPVPAIMNSKVQHSVPLPTPSTSKHTQPAVHKKTYTIRRGDTLWGIAVKEYGKGTLWTKIKAANPKLVPTDLQIGTKITIP